MLAVTASLVLAQSGRGRQPVPAPPPKPVPRTGANAPVPPGVAEGGRLARQDVDGATTRYVLRNGLTIIFRERHSQPLAAVTTWVKAGALSEADTETGLAQLTARMLLKGTGTRQPGEIERDTGRLGGQLQTEVSFDRSLFRIVAPSESVGKVLELQADFLQNPAFAATELKKASQEVIRAGRRFQDEAEAVSLERLYATAFTAHRLKRGHFGTEPSLSALTREQVVSFYQTHYQPQNTIIAIDGDVFGAQTIVQIQQLFGKWKGQSGQPGQPGQPAQTTGIASVVEPPQDKLRYSNSRGDISQSIVTIGYHMPPPASTAEALRERAALEMLAAVLGLGDGSRLVQVLREGSRLPADVREKGELAGLVSDVSAEYQSWPGAALLAVQLRVDPARIDRAEAEYLREIERFKREVIGDGELQRARYLLEKRFYDSQSRVETEADLLARYQAQFGDFRLFDANLSRLGAVTPQELQQAAAKYLTLANMAIHEYESRSVQARTFTNDSFVDTITIFAPTLTQPVKPEEVKSAVALRTFKQGAERGGATEGRNVIISEAPLPVKDFSVLRGARAFVREDRSQPKLTIGIYFQGGRLIEETATSGMTELMLRAMIKSTTTRKSDLIALETESYGAEINIVNEPDFFGITLDTLSRNAEPATRLVLDILENPFFDKAEFIRERERLLADQLAARDCARCRAEELMLASLYPSHPYGLPRYGLASVVKPATEAQLEAWYARTIKRQLPLVVIVGDTDGSSLVSRIFSEGFKRADLDKTMKVGLPGLMESPQQQAEVRERQQATQAIGLRSAAGSSVDVSALDVLAHFATTRFGMELRDRQAVVDEIYVRSEARLASGMFTTIAISAPELEARALEAVRGELAGLAKAPPTGDDFDLGRNEAIGNYAISVAAHPTRALEYARAVINGRKAADVDGQPDLIRAVKLADVKRVAEAVLKVAQAGLGVVHAEETKKN